MDQDEFKNPDTGLCKQFDARNGRKLIINTMDRTMYDHYLKRNCFKGNLYCDYCEYCPKDLCLYYKPTVQLSPPAHAGIIILDKNEK